MTRLEGPIRELLDDAPSEARIAALERGVTARRLGREEQRPAWPMIVAPALAGALAAVLVLALSGRMSSKDDAREASAPGTPLARGELVDGARVEATPSGGVAIVRSLEEVRFVLPIDGHIALDVPDGTGRHWVVDAGLARVDVVGTKFAVARFADRAVVDVERGRVRVTSDALEGGVRELGPGEHLEVHARTAERDAKTAGEVRAASAHDEHANAASEHGARTEPTQATETSEGRRTSATTARSGDAELDAKGAAERGGQAGAARAADRKEDRKEDRAGHRTTAAAARDARPDAAQPEAHDADQGAVDEVAALLAAADEARSHGAPERAIELLTRVYIEHAQDPRAGLAAFTRARLEQDVLARPNEAVRALELALHLGLPSELDEPARARLFEAHAALGHDADARQAARDYLEHHPTGRRADAARAIAEHGLAGSRDAR